MAADRSLLLVFSLFVLFPVLATCAGRRSPDAEEAPAPGDVELARAADADSATSAERVGELAARRWEWILAHRPEVGTSLGDHRRDAELTDVSDAARRREGAESAALLAELRTVDATRLTGQDRITHEVLGLDLMNWAERARLELHLWDVDQMDGVHLSFPFHVRQEHPRRDARDLDHLLTRYRAHGKQVDAVTANLRLGLSRGYVASRQAVLRVTAQLEEELRHRPSARALYADPAKMPASMPAAARQDLARTLNDVVVREIHPALERMRKMLAEEYLPRTREEVGIWTLPNGEEAYRQLIREHTSMDRTPQEIHDLGVRELASIETEMLAIARKLGHKGDLASFSRRLRGSPRNYHGTRQALLTGFRGINDRAWQALPRAFGALPNAACEVRSMEAFQERDAPAAFYSRPSDDGARPGVFYANLREPRTRPRYNMEALTFHEAVPGHHLQIAIAQQVRGLPDLRRHGGFTVFVEGWGLYAERLADEMGLYSDDLARYGMLNYQAWRANRLIVDTGMHQLRWSRQRAIDFLKEHSALTEPEIVNEIDRYVIWPGQALAYMVGALEIRRIRKKAEDALGEAFDLRGFHDALLGSGAVPMATAERIVDEWVAGTRGRAVAGATTEVPE